MKKTSTASRGSRRRLVAAAAALGVLAAACGGSDGDGGDGGEGTGAENDAGGDVEPIEITAATYIPPSYHDLYGGFETFMEEAGTASDGNITFDWYDSGTLLEADQLVPGLTQGVADLIFTTSSYISSTYPILGVYELPFVNEDFETQREALAFDGELRGFLNEQLGEQNLRTIGTMPTTFQWIWTADKQVTTPEDLRGMRIRVAGPLEGRTVEALGASPVTMSSAEVYEALERGTIDGLMSYIGTIPGRSLQEVISYGTAAPFGAYSVDAYVRADWFDGLPEATQEALLQAGEVYSQEGTDHMVQVHEGEYREAIESAGVEIVELDEEQMTAFQEAVQPSWDQWRESVSDPETADRALELMEP
ncbi:TRAP transporter substrate-binding protein [Ornithinicoccus halotolerans]|uniref:TRAP transporter substrate-binding protein n=1 Tax=Ornithinicoccus halotolerans TaxID=1748220 RepID=UPI001296407D|nr:TRAP transporter substrate-binding protein DctP [Ornithinicoccus halotolerans]